MEIAVIGISHKEAPVPIRGEVAFTTSMKKKATAKLTKAGLLEFMIISTCNRSEIYIASKDMNKDIDLVKSYYVEMAGTKILPFIFLKKYSVALQHIYQVATGLNSLIVGEDEILGQMKRSLDFGVEHKSCRKYMTKVIREAVTFSKKIRHAYKLSENQLSVASIGINYLKDYYGSIKDKKILLIGTGAMGQLILRYLESENNPNIYLTNRTFNKDKVKYYVDNSINVIKYDDRYKLLNDMDIIISATASPHTIIQADVMDELEKPVTFLDMAVPRDIDPRIDQMEYANVVTLDDFNAISKQHLKMRQGIGNQINRLILEEVKELELWILRSKVDGVIKEFHLKQNKVLTESMNQLKGSIELSEEHEKLIYDILKRSTWAMIKEPVEQLKALKEVEDIDHYKMIIEKLFDFEGGED